MTPSSAGSCEQIKKFADDLRKCMKCGNCAFFCPIYREEPIESSVARGKNMMVRGLVAGDLEYTPELAARLSKCTLCMSCTANCPIKANIPNIVVAARADIAGARGVKFPYNIIYRWFLPRRRLFGTVLRLASWLQKAFMPGTEGTIRHLPMFLSALGKGRHIPQIAPRFFRQVMPEVNRPPDSATGIRAGYFTGCMTEYVFPRVGEKVVGFLTRHGVEVTVPRQQGCCGAPVFLGAGDFATGRKLADANVGAFEGLDYVITTCASCGSALKDYLKFLADTPERQAAYARFADKVIDISAFLVDVLKLPASAYRAAPEVKGAKVTWHDPCHLNRHLGIAGQPRQILESMSGIEYVEMPGAGDCCGMAGTFSIYYYDISRKIAERKINAIKSVDAGVVATGCPGCQIQLLDGSLRQGMPLKVKHIMELLE